MPAPEDQTLYVMQNEFGFIKIGRSTDPEQRRRKLEFETGCRIGLVHELPGQGHREEAIHLSLSEHWIGGEWFEGTAVARKEIERKVPGLLGCKWPFRYAADRADAWLEEFFDRRSVQSAKRLFYHLLNEHLRRFPPGKGADATAAQLLALSETGDMPVAHHGRERVEFRRYDKAGRLIGRYVIPRYTTELDAALRLWPADACPREWKGTAFDCAVAALAERYRRFLREGPTGAVGSHTL